MLLWCLILPSLANCVDCIVCSEVCLAGDSICSASWDVCANACKQQEWDAISVLSWTWPKGPVWGAIPWSSWHSGCPPSPRCRREADRAVKTTCDKRCPMGPGLNHKQQPQAKGRPDTFGHLVHFISIVLKCLHKCWQFIYWYEGN